MEKTPHAAPPPIEIKKPLDMPPPAKPVQGRGYKRLRWRTDGRFQNHDRPRAKGFESIEVGLQRWFYELLPERHVTMQKGKYYVSPEAWRLFIDNLEFWREEWAKEQERARALRATERQKERVEVKKGLAKVADKAGLKPADLKTKLAKIKKLVTAATADGFALAVELVRSLELDNEATWLTLLNKRTVARLNDLKDDRILNQLLEIAGGGRRIGRAMLSHLSDGGFYVVGRYLTNLSDAAAASLAKQEGDLYLNGLTSLSDAAAASLAKHERTDRKSVV